MKNAISLAMDLLASRTKDGTFPEMERSEKKYWKRVSKLYGEALALVIAENPNDATCVNGYKFGQHDFDFSKLDAKGWIMLLARWPEVAYSMSFECEESVWESESRDSNDEIVPGVHWVYEVHAGRAYITGTQGTVLTENDKKSILAEWEAQGLPLLNMVQNTLLDGVVNVSGGTCTIPSHVDGIPVFTLSGGGLFHFNGSSAFTKLVVSEGIVELRGFPFCDAAESIEVILPSTLKSIWDCKWDTYENVIISCGTFSACHGLSAFSVAEDNPCFKSERGLLLTKDGKTLIHGVNGYVTIPDGVMHVGSLAFQGCRGLKSVTMPDSVSSIGNQAFDGCESLTRITIPDGVKRIKDYTFKDCKRLKSVVIGKGVERIGDSAFDGCGALEGFMVNDVNPNFKSVSGLLLTKDGKTLIHGVNGDVTIPDGVISIERSAFAGCSGLKSVTIPDSMTRIGGWAFEGCSESVFNTTAIPNVKLVDGWVIDHADSLSGNLDLIGVRGIGDYALSRFCKLRSVTMPDSVVSIGALAFDGCSELESVTISNGVMSIGDYAFQGCRNLKSVVMPKRFKDRQDKIFWCCSKSLKVTYV